MESKNDISVEQGSRVRRSFLKTATAFAAAAPAIVGALGAQSAQAKLLGENTDVSEPQGALLKLQPNAPRRLHLINEHTGDNVDAVYFVGGFPVNTKLQLLNKLMRDRRANKAIAMDTHLYDQLFLLRSALGTEEPIHILSGYRTRQTNAKLRKRSKGVAKYSLHMEGRAADIFIPGISPRKIQEAAISLNAGGVGLYSRLNFVHVDTGAVRYWGR